MMLVVKNIHGSRMYLDTLDAGLSTDLLREGTREGRCPYIVEEMVRPDWVCLDVGANIGFYALIEGRRGATVYAIEPSPENYHLLQLSCELNGYDIHPRQIALGDQNRVTDFYLKAKKNWSCVAAGETKRSRSIGEVREIVRVRMMTLDSFVESEGIERVDLLRCDIEGFETNLIVGAERTLSSMKPGSVLFIEFHASLFPNPRQDFIPPVERLMEYGFVPREVVGPGQELMERPPSEFARGLAEYREESILTFWRKS